MTVGPNDSVRQLRLAEIFARRAALLRELADLDQRLAAVLEEAMRPVVPDAVLGLKEAAAFLGEAPATFRRRLEYRKALLTRPGERNLRYSRVELERIKKDRLTAASMDSLSRW